MSTGQRVVSLLLGGMLLVWIAPAWAQLAPAEALLPDREASGAGESIPQGEAAPAPLEGALAMLAYDARPAPDPGFDPVERAWFAAAGSLEDRVERTLDAALAVGRPSLEALARALLLDESLGNPLERAEAAVLLAPDLPAARIALGEALWSEERDLTGALDQVRQAALASNRHLEASLWLRAAISHGLFTACMIGGLFFLFVAGGSLVLAAAHLLGRLPVALPMVSRVALVAGLLLIPAVLGEGLFGVALVFAALGLWPGNSWQRVSVGVALLVSIAGLHPLADRAGEELVALGSDPVAEAAFAVEHGQPSRIEIDRLEHAAPGDPLVARALALHAKRSGSLEDAERRYTALIEEGDSPNPRLLNNAANVQLALDRTERAIELYEAAAQSGHLVVVLFNLSQAYGRLVQLDQQDLALAEAQVIDPAALAALTELYGSSRGTMAVDLPVAAETIQVRLGDPAAAQLAATALRSRVAPGWLGQSLAHSAVGVALVVLLASGIALAVHRAKDGGKGGDRHAGIARFLTGKEAADPFLRMVRLTELRERQARIDKIKFLFSAIVPGAAGVVSRHPILGLLGSMLFGLTLASWWVQEGVGADPLAIGAGASFLFSTVAVASAVAYAAVIALTIALWERS